MQAVLDVPVRADVMAAGGGRLAVDLAAGLDLAHGSQPSKAVPLGEPGHVVEELGTADLDPAVVTVDRLRRVVRCSLRIVEQQSNVLEERLLVAFEHTSGAVKTPRPHMESPSRSRIPCAVALWRCMASAVTMQPSRVKSASITISSS